MADENLEENREMLTFTAQRVERARATIDPVSALAMAEEDFERFLDELQEETRSFQLYIELLQNPGGPELTDAKENLFSGPEGLSKFIGQKVTLHLYGQLLADRVTGSLIRSARRGLISADALRAAVVTYENRLRTSTRQLLQTTPAEDTDSKDPRATPPYLFGGPVYGMLGKGKETFCYVFEGSQVRFGKVGRREAVKQEHNFAEMVHSKLKAPTVINTLRYLRVPAGKDEGVERGVCVMPLHSLTVQRALASMHSGKDNMTAVHATLLYNFVLCSLATLEAFRLIGYCYGDLKPANALLRTDSNVIVSVYFGGVVEYGQRLKEATDVYTLGLPDVAASLHFDLTRLLASAIEVIVGRPPAFETVATIRELKVDAAAQPLLNSLVKAVDSRLPDSTDLEPLACEISALATSASVQGLVNLDSIWPRPLTPAT